ncbi:hypothetical protein Tco_0770707 [Tanacetum coccineum]|uniref:Uncharacterized protein n=1 Tax=Tanacetum coccineum TaxID=301880 RepID=A0ABQ4ZEA7_9ASTR
MLDKKELSLTLDDFRTILHLPQVTDNNYDSFMPPPSFLDMVPFYKNELGFTMELKTSSSFKTTGLLQLWQTLCKIFSKCLTTRVTGWDQPPLQIMQMMKIQNKWKNDFSLDESQKNKYIGALSDKEEEITERSPRIHTDLVSSDTEKLQELTVTDTTPTPSSSSLNTKLSTTNRLLSLFKAKPARFKRYKSFFQELQGRYGYLFEHLRAKFLSRKSFDTLADHLQEVMVESLPTMVDKHIKEQVKKQVPEQVKVQVPVSYMSGHILHVHLAQPQTSSVQEQQYQLTSAVRLKDQDDPYDDVHLEGENSAKRNQEQTYDYDFWTKSYASDDDEVPMKQVSQDIMEEVSLTINEAEL